MDKKRLSSRLVFCLSGDLRDREADEPLLVLERDDRGGTRWRVRGKGAFAFVASEVTSLARDRATSRNLSALQTSTGAIACPVAPAAIVPPGGENVGAATDPGFSPGPPPMLHAVSRATNSEKALQRGHRIATPPHPAP